jgi:hypothetical protein
MDNVGGRKGNRQKLGHERPQRSGNGSVDRPPTPPHPPKTEKQEKTTTDITRTPKKNGPMKQHTRHPIIHVYTTVGRNHVICESRHTLWAIWDPKCAQAYSPPPWRYGPTRAMASSFLRFLDHTQRRITVGRTPLDEWSARRRDLYLKTHNTHNRQTSMPPVGFESTISAGERPQTYALDRAATGTGAQAYCN